MWAKAKEFLKWVGFLLFATFLWLFMLYLVGVTKSLIPFLVFFIGVFPVIEEWFKSNHSNTVVKAHLFGILEFVFIALALIYTPDIPYDRKVTLIVAKTMSLVMHWATGMLHYRANFDDQESKRKTYFVCVMMHSVFNICIHYAKIQSFDIMLFAPYFVLYIATYFWKPGMVK